MCNTKIDSQNVNLSSAVAAEGRRAVDVQ